MRASCAVFRALRLALLPWWPAPSSSSHWHSSRGPCSPVQQSHHDGLRAVAGEQGAAAKAGEGEAAGAVVMARGVAGARRAAVQEETKVSGL